MVYFLIIAATILRLIPHPPNFAPITAMALFGAGFLPKKYAIIVPLSAMLISDFFLGFHKTMVFVYGSFVLIAFLGFWLLKKRSLKSIVLASILSSVLFFIVTNFGVWLLGWYPRTWEGLMACYIAAIPFFRNTLVGDLFYVGVMFGAAEFVTFLIKNKKYAFLKILKP